MIYDFSRQSELFNRDDIDAPVTIIGAGATGSWLAMFLAKLGFSDIRIWDFDTVEEHNIPNQIYGEWQVGEPKVQALEDMLNGSTGIQPTIYNQKFENQRLSGYVFLMVDSMSERKRIWNNAIKLRSQIKLLIEPRMGLEMGRIYTVNPLDMKHIGLYEQNFYSDDNAEVSACGTSMTVVTTAAIVASLCAKQLINKINGEDLDNEILVDLKYNQFYNTKWS
jgi:molybdopterin/thiamine biosynthesis adenylyltransferase